MYILLFVLDNIRALNLFVERIFEMKKLIGVTLSVLLIMTAMCSCGNRNNEQNIGDDGKLTNEENIDDRNNVNDKNNQTSDNGLMDDAGNAIKDTGEDIRDGIDNAADSVDDTLSGTNNNNSTATK